MLTDLPIADKRLVFLVGAPRSGTTWVQLMLSSAPEVASANETHLFSSYFTSLFDSWDSFKSSLRGIGIHHVITNDEYLKLIREFASGVLAAVLAKKPGASVILEKTPDHVKVWQRIQEVFPSAYAIHLIRDPRSVVASLQAAQSTWGREWLTTETADHCKIWLRCVKDGQEIARRTENYLQIRYEDFMSDGPKTLQSVFAWMKVDRTLEQCQEIVARYAIDQLRAGAVSDAPWNMASEPKDFYRRGTVDGWAADLSPKQVALVEEMTREAMVNLGYQPASKSRSMSNVVKLRFAMFYDRAKEALHGRARRLVDQLLSSRG